MILERTSKGEFAGSAFIMALLAVFIVVGSSVCYGAESGPAEEKRVDATSYNMKVKLDAKKDALSETVTMNFKNNTDKSLSEIYIRDMTPAALDYYKKNFAGRGSRKLSSNILSITRKGSKKNLKYTQKKGKTVLVVKMGKAVKPGETAAVVVRMKTAIPNRQDRFGFQKTKDGKLYALSFCFPYLADNKNGKWNTDPFFDEGESRSSDLANYKVKFTAPKSYVVAATGNSRTKKGITTITAKHVRDFAIVACNFMKKETYSFQGIKVNNYYLDGKHGKQYRKITKLVADDSIRLFTENVGRYPYDELDMVQCLFGFGFGGMEYPGLVMLNGQTYYSGGGNKYGAQSLMEVVTHEIGHQWFYSAVGNREYTEGWIDEGFTTFLERDVYGLTPNRSNQYIRTIEKDMMPSYDALKKDQREFVDVYRKTNKGMYLNVSPSKYPKGRSYGDVEYDGGYLFLVEIRNAMGVEKFSAFFKEYYKRYFMKIATTRSIVKLIRQYDNCEKINEIIGFYIR